MSRPRRPRLRFSESAESATELQLLQHELRDDERAVEEPGLADVGDPAVDDHAGVEDLVAALRAGGAEQAQQPRGLEPFAVLAAEHQAQVGQGDQHEAVEELDAAIAAVGPEQAGDDGARDRQTDRATDQRTENPCPGGFAEAALDQHDQGGETEREGDICGNADRQRLERRRGVGDRDDKKQATEREPGHGAGPPTIPPPPVADNL